MKRRLTSFGCLVLGAILGFALQSIAYKFAGISGVMAVAAFVAADAYRVQVWRFGTGFPTKPITFALLFLFLGPLLVCWYFGLRLKIRVGTAELREEKRKFHGYLQPWRSMPLR
jgi:hypothetical protein